MVSRIKRIVTRTPKPSPDLQEPVRERVDPATLLPQVQAGLNALEATAAALCRREQELLAEASAIYERLKDTALELADIRQQLEVTTKNADKLQTAVQLLEGRHAATHNLDHGEPPRPEALVIQPQD